MTPQQLITESSQNLAEQSQAARSQMKELILAKLSSGVTYKTLAETDTLPNYVTVMKWAESDESFAAALTRSRLAGGLIAADKASDFVDQLMDVDDVKTIDTKALASILLHLRWVASRQARNVYGDQIEVKHSGTVNIRTSFLIPRTKESVDNGDIIDIDAVMQPAGLGDEAVTGEGWMG